MIHLEAVYHRASQQFCYERLLPLHHGMGNEHIVR